jgi:hypothetical protein
MATERTRKEFQKGVPDLAMDQTHPLLLVERVHLRIRVFEQTGYAIVPNTPYELKGDNGKKYSGHTDPEGHIEHLFVPYGNYSLKISDSESGKDYTVAVPWVVEEDELHLQHIPELVFENLNEDVADDL